MSKGTKCKRQILDSMSEDPSANQHTIGPKHGKNYSHFFNKIFTNVSDVKACNNMKPEHEGMQPP